MYEKCGKLQLKAITKTLLHGFWMIYTSLGFKKKLLQYGLNYKEKCVTFRVIRYTQKVVQHVQIFTRLCDQKWKISCYTPLNPYFVGVWLINRFQSM